MQKANQDNDCQFYNHNLYQKLNRNDKLIRDAQELRDNNNFSKRYHFENDLMELELNEDEDGRHFPENIKYEHTKLYNKYHN